MEFRLREENYVGAFLDDERRRVEDSAAAILVDRLRRHFGFVTFTDSAADSTPRVLLITLDKKDRGPTDSTREVGLHILLLNPPADSTDTYWILFQRPGDEFRRKIRIPTFLVELRAVLDKQRDAEWNRVVTEHLSRIMIAADTAVAVWGSPPSSWLIPYRPRDICIEPRTGKLRVQSQIFTRDGHEEGEFIASTRATFDPPVSAGVPPGVLARFKDHIHAKPIEPPVVAPADSLKVQGVYIAEYHFDKVNCATASPPSAESNP